MRRTRTRVARLIALFALLGLAPLLLLAYFSVSLSTDAVEREAAARVEAVASGRADAVETELSALVDVVEAYAQRPRLIEALRAGDGAAARDQLGELRAARNGIAIAFLADRQGVLIDIVPSTPSIVGKDFSFRDWHRGLTATGRSYVSEAYVTQARSRERVVAAATYVRPASGGEPLAILVAGYSLDHVQRFVDRFQAEQGVRVTVTDQRGVLLARPGGVPPGLRSRTGDRAVAAALRGERGVLRRDGLIVAYAPVPGLGWAVTTSVREESAFASVATLRKTVLTIAGVLALVLAAGIAILGRTLWLRAEAERRLAAQNEQLEAAHDELESQNAELAVQATELEDSQAQLEQANDELQAQQAELERAFEELAGEKERTDAFFAFGERIAAETELASLSRIVLSALADFAQAELGTLYVADEEREDAPCLVSARGVEPDRLPERVTAGAGLAGRALAERRTVTASYDETALRLAAFGEEVAVRHELHVPLFQGERALGVLTLARVSDRGFSPPEIEAIDHLAEQGAVALANALSYRRAVRLLSINRAVLDTTRDAIRMVDLDGNPLLSNVRFDALMAELRPHEDTDELVANQEALEELREPTASDPEYEGEHDIELLEESRSFRLFTSPVRDAGGDPIGRLDVIREVTAEREAERLKSELVATVSHELRTPLASIVGFSELMKTRALDEATRTRYVETMHDEARRLTALVNDFLDVHRIEEGSFTLDLAPFELGGLIRRQVELFAGQSEAHELRLELPDEPLEVVGERDRIAQVVANLVSNAIKYSPAGGTVRVGAAQRNGSVRVSVQDEGIGIPTGQQPRIFQKFFRVDSSDTRAIGGTGLGLSLAREIVVAHGGRMGFDSVEGEGSTFWFELPSGPRRAANGLKHVLVVEDDEAAAELLRSWLEHDGHQVEVASSGEEGLRRAAERRPDVVCLDIKLGGDLDGWEVLARLKEGAETAGVPVVVCTGGNGRDRAASLGAADFLAKPLSPEELRRAVARLLPEERGSVLVVDDDPGVRRLVVETLAGDGLEVGEAGDGAEALAAIAADAPDAIVLDLVMPGLDGFAVLERLQRDPATRLLPVIVLTARTLTPAQRKLLRRRAVSVLNKSTYSPGELRRLVELAVGR